ncbi:MAG: L-threonylcarbamoyladenylate synthase [Bacteroidota bacterium]
MKTEILDLRKDPDKHLAKALEILNKGGIIAFPTETVYGLGAKISNTEACKKIFSAKNRPQDNPLAAHISKPEQVEKYIKDVPDSFYKLAEKFLPGPLSVIMEKKDFVNDIITGGLKTLSIRFPQNQYALRLINEAGEPLAATSANKSGRPSPITASHVFSDLSGIIPLILDGGPAQFGYESTVLSLTGDKPLILRPGVITIEEIAETLGLETDQIYKGPENEIHDKYKHYSPEAELVILNDIYEIDDFLNENKNRKIMLLSNKQPDCDGYTAMPLNAATLYANFRIADQELFDTVVILVDDSVRNDKVLYHRISYARSSNRII